MKVIGIDPAPTEGLDAFDGRDHKQREDAFVLKRLWDRLVLGQRTVGEVAADFGRQLPAVRIVLFKWFTAELAKSGVRGALPGASDSDLSRVYAAQIVNYLAGDLIDPSDEQIPEPVRRFALQINEEIPEIADNLMKQDKQLREIVVQTLRMRFSIGSAQDADFPGSKGGKRVALLLQLYGSEFPDPANEHRYMSAVDNLVAWSKSDEFIGRDVRV